jgi:hypothetical protein
LIVTTPERYAAVVAAILNGTRPIAFIPTDSQEDAIQLGISARDAGLGVAILVQESESIMVLVVGTNRKESQLRKFAERFGAEIATDRRCQYDRVHVTIGCEPVQ